MKVLCLDGPKDRQFVEVSALRPFLTVPLAPPRPVDYLAEFPTIVDRFELVQYTLHRYAPDPVNQRYVLYVYVCEGTDPDRVDAREVEWLYSKQ